MSEDISWRTVRPADPDFWTLVGPMCLSALMRREIGECPHVEDADHWVVAQRLDGAVVAVSALRVAKRGGVLCHAFVHPDYRGRGLYGEMIARREEEARALGLGSMHAVASDASRPGLERRGYTLRGKRGSFTLLRKELHGGPDADITC